MGHLGGGASRGCYHCESQIKDRVFPEHRPGACKYATNRRFALD